MLLFWFFFLFFIHKRKYISSAVSYDDRVAGMVVSGRGKMFFLEPLIEAGTKLHVYHNQPAGRDPQVGDPYLNASYNDLHACCL
jgi:hypothetical protein